MILNLDKFYQDNNFKVSKNVHYGIYRKRVISIVHANSLIKVTISFNTQLLKEAGQQISNRMSELKKNYKALQKALTTNIYEELIIYEGHDINEVFLPILNGCLDILDEFIAPQIENCPFCHRVMPSNSPFIRLNESVIQGHDECINQLIETSKHLDIEKSMNDKQAILKTIGVSLLSMLIVCGFILLLSFYNLFSYVSFLSGWGFFLLTTFLLKKFKIILTKKDLIIFSIFSFLSIILSLYFGMAISIYKSNGDLAFTYILTHFFSIIINSTGALKLLLLDFVFSVLLVAPSLYIRFKQRSAFNNKIEKI